MSTAPPLNATYINKKAGKVFPFLPINIRMNGNNKDGKKLNIQTEFAVVGNKSTFPNEIILDETGVIHSILSQPTFFTRQEVGSHFEDELDKAKSDSEESSILLEMHDTIKDRTREHRQEVINNLSLQDIGIVEQATKLYIGNFFFWKMVDIWDLVMHDIQTIMNRIATMGVNIKVTEQREQVRESVKKNKLLFEESTLMEELLNGKTYDRAILERGAYGGIAPFIDHIKAKDKQAHEGIQKYTKWALKEATKQLRMTPERNLKLYHIAKEAENYEYCRSQFDTTAIKKNNNDKQQEKTDSQYVKMYQNPAINTLAIIGKKMFVFDKHTKTAKALKGDVAITIDNLPKIDNIKLPCLEVQTKKVLDILLIKLAEKLHYRENRLEEIKKNREVAITLDEYMRFLKINDKKEARKKLNESIKSLYNVTLEYDEPRWEKGKKIVIHWKVRVLDAIAEDYEENPIKNGVARVKFTFDAADWLTNSYITEFPTALFAVSAKNNPHSYYLGRKLTLHHNENIAKPNANRIGAKSLVNSCPDLPTYDEVMATGRQVTKRVIEPFERDMNALEDCDVLIEWHYCNSQGIPLTDEQLADYSYNEWITWLVEFELANYPDQTERIAKIEARQKKAKEHNAKQAKEK